MSRCDYANTNGRDGDDSRARIDARAGRGCRKWNRWEITYESYTEGGQEGGCEMRENSDRSRVSLWHVRLLDSVGSHTLA